MHNDKNTTTNYKTNKTNLSYKNQIHNNYR